MGNYFLFMLRVREIVEGLRVFERNKVPFEVKIPGIVTCIQTSSLGRTARNSLSELHPVSIDISLEQGGLKRDCLLHQRKREDT